MFVWHKYYKTLKKEDISITYEYLRKVWYCALKENQEKWTQNIKYSARNDLYNIFRHDKSIIWAWKGA